MKLSLAMLVLLAVARPAGADVTWIAARGTVEPGRLPGSYILATDAAPGRFSYGAMVSKELVRLPYRLDVTWRRLGPESGRSMEVRVAGGVVLVREGKIAFWAYDESAFARNGWTRIPGLLAHDEHVLTVTQDHREVIVTLDGARTVRFPLPVVRDAVHVGVGMKGAIGFRSTIYIRSLAVRAQ